MPQIPPPGCAPAWQEEALWCLGVFLLRRVEQMINGYNKTSIVCQRSSSNCLQLHRTVVDQRTSGTVALNGSLLHSSPTKQRNNPYKVARYQSTTYGRCLDQVAIRVRNSTTSRTVVQHLHFNLARIISILHAKALSHMAIHQQKDFKTFKT